MHQSKLNPIKSNQKIPENGGLNVGIDEVSVQERSVGSNGPDEASPGEAVGQGNVDDDLLHGRLLLVSDGDQVASPHPPDPPGNVQEEDAWGYELTPVPLVATHDQVGQPICAAQEPLLPVVIEPVAKN